MGFIAERQVAGRFPYVAAGHLQQEGGKDRTEGRQANRRANPERERVHVTGSTWLAVT